MSGEYDGVALGSFEHRADPGPPNPIIALVVLAPRLGHEDLVRRGARLVVAHGTPPIERWARRGDAKPRSQARGGLVDVDATFKGGNELNHASGDAAGEALKLIGPEIG